MIRRHMDRYLLTHARLASEAADHSVVGTYDRDRLNAELEITSEARRTSPAELPALSDRRTASS